MVAGPIHIEAHMIGWDLQVSHDKLWRRLEFIVDEHRGEIRHRSSGGGPWTVLAIEDPTLLAAFSACFLAMFEDCTIREGAA